MISMVSLINSMGNYMFSTKLILKYLLLENFVHACKVFDQMRFSIFFHLLLYPIPIPSQFHMFYF